MMKMESKRAGKESQKAKHLAVLAFFLCPLSLQAASNWVEGPAYGTTDWSTAGAIFSQASTNGSLIVGHESTTNLTLAHNITGFVSITNKVDGLTLNATGATLTSSIDYVFAAVNATNLVITGGHFIGAVGSDGSSPPPIPDQTDSTNSTRAAMGGLLLRSTATINGAEFAGIEDAAGLTIDRSELTTTNSTFRGGNTGAGLVARNHSMVTIQSGSFTGGVGNTAFYLQDSDATIYDGTFSGNIGGTNNIAGDGLFSKLTGATTNQVNLHGGTFSSIAFFGVDGSVQHVLAGANLTIQNGIIQNGGTVLIDDQSDGALTDIWIESGTMDFGSNAFSLPDEGTLGFGIGENTNGFLTAGTAYFHTNSTLDVNASAAGFSSGTTNIVLLSTTGGIFMVGTSTNAATSADFTDDNVTATVSGRTKLEDIFVDSDRFLRFHFTTLSLGEYWDVDGPMARLADELEAINHPAMMATIDAIDDPDLSQAITEETYFTTMNTFQTAMQGLQAAVGPSASRGAEFREQLKLTPPGAKGPERKNDLRGWGKFHGQFYTHDADGLNPEYEATLHGGVIGIDKSLGNLLVGISGGSGRYSVTRGIDGEENTTAYHGALYTTYGTDRVYFDAGIAYGFNEVETRTTRPFVLDGEFDAQILSAYFGGGYDLIDTKGGTVFTPEASIQYSTYKQDAYSETSTTAVPRNIDAFDADSLRSSLGIGVSMLNTTALETFGFKIDGRVHWLHEFNPEPGNIGFSLDGGSNDYQLAHPLLDEELFRVGFGASFFNTLRQKPKNVLLRIDFDEFFGDGFNAHNLSAKVIYAF